MGFQKNMLMYSRRRLIVMKFGMSVDRDAAQLVQGQIFDICPWKNFTPLQIFPYHYGQWDGNFQSAISPSVFSKSGWNLRHTRAATISIFQKIFRNQNSPNSKKVQFSVFSGLSYLEIGWRFFREIFRICSYSDCPHGLFVKLGSAPNFCLGRGANIGHFWMGAWATPPGGDIMHI